MFPLLVVMLAVDPPAPPVRQLTVSPAPEPRPALKYELLSPLRDRQPDNAALHYLRAYAARPPAPTDANAAQARHNRLDEWQDTPLDALPQAEVRAWLDDYRSVFRELNLAVKSQHCDWRNTPDGASGLSDLLNELQPAREVIRALSIRTRLELSQGRFPEAAESIRVGLQATRDVGEAPTLIQLLVGLALQAIVLERVEEWIARPGSPNLYWALTNLPRPLIDPRPGFEGEAVLLESFVPNLVRLRAGPLPKDEAAKVIDGILADLRRIGGDSGVPASALEQIVDRVGLAGYVAWKYPTARKELIAAGRPEAEIALMPEAQVVYIASYERFLNLRDDQRKWLGAPYHLARPHLSEVARRARQATEDGISDTLFRVFALTLPASEKVLESIARSERKVALLRTIEALRMYATDHDGVPPARLTDAPVPVPDDPETGKPFLYEIRGETVVLTAPPPDGDAANRANTICYEITFRRVKK